MPTFVEIEPALRKVAILIASLEPAAATILLEQMPSADARRIEQLAATLTDIDPDEREQVLAEFAAGDATREESGCEVDDSLTRRLAADGDGATGEPREAEPPRFRYLPWSALPASAIGSSLLAETPQVIAVVLTHLPPAQAAEVLATLPATVQGEVLRRIAQAPRPAPEVVAEIIEVIEARLPWADREPPAEELQLETARAIVDAASADQRRRWLDEIRPSLETSRAMGLSMPKQAKSSAASSSSGHSNAPNDLTEQASDAAHDRRGDASANGSVERSARTVHDLEQLLNWSDGRLAKLFASADPQDVVLAFAAAAPDVVRRLHTRLKPDESRALERQWTRLGPFRLTDAQRATHRLLAVAARL